METLHEEVTDELRAILEKWEPKEGNLIMILHGVQQQYGYVPWNISKFLASELSVPLARIFEVITFTTFLILKLPLNIKFLYVQELHVTLKVHQHYFKV
jgi:NADH:ubiquinone oxidoreductase subunit E